MATFTRSPAPEAQMRLVESELSVDIWAAMPETKPHYQLIDGELKRKIPARRSHTRAIGMLIFLLMTWGKDGFLTAKGRALALTSPVLSCPILWVSRRKLNSIWMRFMMGRRF